MFGTGLSVFDLALYWKNTTGALKTHGLTSNSTLPSGKIEPGPSALSYCLPPIVGIASCHHVSPLEGDAPVPRGTPWLPAGDGGGHMELSGEAGVGRPGAGQAAAAAGTVLL